MEEKSRTRNELWTYPLLHDNVVKQEILFATIQNTEKIALGKGTLVELQKEMMFFERHFEGRIISESREIYVVTCAELQFDMVKLRRMKLPTDFLELFQPEFHMTAKFNYNENMKFYMMNVQCREIIEHRSLYFNRTKLIFIGFNYKS